MSSQTIITLTGDEKSAYEAFKRIIDQEAKAVAKTKELGEAAKKTGADLAGMTLKPIDTKTVRNAKVDTDALSAAVTKAKASGQGDWFDIDNLPLLESVSVLGAVGLAIGTATKAWDLYKQKQKEALDSQKENQSGDQRLIQIAADEADALKMIKRSDDAALATGVDRKTARNVLFTAKSEGFDQVYEAILASSRVVAPEAQAVVAGKLPAIFNNEIKPLESVSMTLKAAQASNLSFEQIASVAPSAAEGAALLGAGPEETLGALSVMSSKFKSPETAADRIKAFSAGLAIDPEFKGLGLVKSYEKLAGMTEEDRSKILGGSQEMNVGYKILGDSLPTIKQRISELESERADFQGGKGMLRRQNEIAMNTPSIKQQFELDRAKVRNEVEIERRLSKAATQNEVASLKSGAIAENKGASMLNRLFTTGADTALSFVLPKGVPAEKRAVLSNVLGDSMERQLWGAPVAQVMQRSKNPGIAAVDMAAEKRGFQDTIDRSFSSEYQTVAPGEQPPQPKDTTPPKADPELLKEIRQANELARQQADLMREQNDLLRQRPNQETTSATNTPADIQKQADRRR